MIAYNDVFRLLSDNGYSSYRLQQEKLISGSTQDRIRSGQPVNLTTIDTICRLCECQPGDFLTWLPDPEEGKRK